jgi:hypothetical protein
MFTWHHHNIDIPAIASSECIIAQAAMNCQLALNNQHFSSFTMVGTGIMVSTAQLASKYNFWAIVACDTRCDLDPVSDIYL